jgi:hypothetical protein
MNCLAYALHFWKKCPHYRLFFNSDHVINVPCPYHGEQTFGSGSWKFMPLESYGYEFIYSGFKDLLTEEEHKLLKEYFNV